MRCFIIILLFNLFSTFYCSAQELYCIVKGKITNTEGKVLETIPVYINKKVMGFSNKYGEFEIQLPKNKNYSLETGHISYENYKINISTLQLDTLEVRIHLSYKMNMLDTLDFYYTHKAETLVGKPDFSIYDFDFFEDKFILLCARKNLSHSEIKLSDYSGNILGSATVPNKAGVALRLYRDFSNNNFLICKDSVYHIEIIQNNLILLNPFNKHYFEEVLSKINDTANHCIYFNNYNAHYPAFSYFYTDINEPNMSTPLLRLSNEELLHTYRMQYYYLKPRHRLDVSRLADELKLDKHALAANLNGFTQSMFFEPLYAPFFIINDSICVFSHHNNTLYRFNTKNKKLCDSVSIQYHHPKNWRNWKKQLLMDEANQRIYAVFKNGPQVSIKRINSFTGKEEGSYKFANPSPTQLKIKDGYAYYIFRPFESTQEKFVYREAIVLTKNK